MVEPWIVAPEVVGSSPSSHPFNISNFMSFNLITTLDSLQILLNPTLSVNLNTQYNFNLNHSFFSLSPSFHLDNFTNITTLMSEFYSQNSSWLFSFDNAINFVSTQQIPNSTQFIDNQDNLALSFPEYDSYDFLQSEITRRQKQLPHLSRRQVFDLMYGLGSNSIEHALNQYENILPTDYSNVYNHRGTLIDVTKLSHDQIMNLSVEVDDLFKFDSLDHIRSTYLLSVPTKKLYYPEPFIASPSFVHNDLGFMHILQYQYWLWFFFVFLIIFFFITFVCTVRWCNLRTQPRRETRGVSRSKCGDLITACVPVTWAMSIIVSESTDATDYYDGFGTSEVIVGVRAFQWGWEYYYPKNLDLNYNIKPSYSTFVGNSLKYSTASEKTLAVNDIWKFYQNKNDDAVITPAHLLVLPLDNMKLFNFLNFSNIGANTLKESNAFKKVRMFSKVYNSNLVHSSSTFTNKYINLNNLYLTENDFATSFNYGLKRQHNLTSSSATTNTYSTFLDQNSMNKFLDYNLNYNRTQQSTTDLTNNFNLVSKNNNSNSTISDTNKINILFESHNLSNNASLNLLSLYPNIVKEINDDSDKKTFNYPLRKLLNSRLYGDGAFEQSHILNQTSLNQTASTTSEYKNSIFFNKSITSQVFTPMSSNQSFLPSERSVRNFSKLTPNKSHYNLSNGMNSLDSNNLIANNLSSSNDSTNFYYLNKSNWVDQSLVAKLSSNRMFFPNSYMSLISNNPHLNNLDYDTSNPKTISVQYNNNTIVRNVNSKSTDSAQILLGSQDGAYDSLSSSYWNMFWSNSNPNLRLDSAIKSSLNNDVFFLPFFTNYADYDFRNAQSLEMLEEAFWESSYSSYNHNDYLLLADNYNKDQSINRKAKLNDLDFTLNNLGYNAQTKPLSTSLNKDISLVGNFYSNTVAFDDLISPASLLNTRDFALFPLYNNSIAFDDSYASMKHNLSLFNQHSGFVLNTNFNFIYPQSYLAVLNNFRADYDDFSWYTNLSESSVTPELDPTNESIELGNNTARFSNPITLRSTARNSIVTYNALQKVFKARFDDGRSNIKINHLADVRSKQPFMTDGRIPYEKLLGKNKESFYNTTFYKTNNFPIFNDVSSLSNSLNFYFFDFPFLMSLASDPSHFAWFDWYTKWSLLEVQPSSVSRYSTIGVPYTKKHFDFNSETGEAIKDAETYFIRISKSRKNYLPLWSYTPYLYAKSAIWSNESRQSLLTVDSNTDITNVTFILNEMNWYWTSLAFSKNTSEYFTPSISGNNMYGHSTWRPYKSIAAYSYNVSLLADMLTKREFLYRQYLESTNKLINLPKIISASPNNPLLQELKATFQLIDPISYNSEYSRELYYNSLSFFKFILFKNWLTSMSNTLEQLPINLNLVTDYLFFYFLNTNSSSKLGTNSDLYKSQFRPLKKGLTSMIRLHSTGAVAMPTEIRLQVLASSRDVIHSWAIPSAGIKIDCVPGYTSHRIMIFFNSGIYWGQCQEICGRYHHWMPIVLYFMKRDLFFLWCTHFTNTKEKDSWVINDRQFSDYIRFASYDKNTWLTELSQTL